MQVNTLTLLHFFFFNFFFSKKFLQENFQKMLQKHVYLVLKEDIKMLWDKQLASIAQLDNTNLNQNVHRVCVVFQEKFLMPLRQVSAKIVKLEKQVL